MMKKSLFAATTLLAAALMSVTGVSAADTAKYNLPKPDDKPADMSKPVKVFLIMGQSNGVGLGSVAGAENERSLENAVKKQGLYSFLVDDSGKWTERKDVRNVQIMDGKGGGASVSHNEWMTVKGGTMGVEYGVGHQLGNALADPVMILKSCIGNRALGWDLLPPDSKRFLTDVKQRDGSVKKMVVAGYKDAPDMWEADPAKGIDTPPPPFVDKKTGKPIAWYAGLQYDHDIANAKKVLSELDKHYPGAKSYELAGIFWWQGEKDCGSEVYASHYEENLVNFIKSVRKEFNAPDAKFVMGTLGEATKDMIGKAGKEANEGKVLEAMLNLDSKSGKHPDLKGIATVYTHDMARNGGGNGHYNKDSRVYMDVGLTMGETMVDLLKK